ncbi:amino acid ABC transporter permease [Streptomyces silvisoli]|uniref:Amino acid ABC transporter permease n=1 Tax=Streptomyces silvisoli TaxID=3034235 RepID=A0ABT5ZR76_9ACTN|nr:amino acid ABC transporter permease [Streptomyces silvisoli]MDF3292318.1 amino acid ABC transporter permease [Streptomyces silvisoli]
MSAGALFDAPGPRTRRRRRIYALASTAAILALAALVALRLCGNGQFAAAVWDPVRDRGLQQRVGDGALAILRAFALAAAGSLALGALLAVGRLSEHRPVRWAATAVVEFFRSLPPLVLVFALYAGALPPSWALVLGLTLYHGCVQAEVLRAGISAVPRGQAEAGYAVGLRKSRVMATVLVPQALRAVLPTAVSQLAVTLKDTSLGFVIAYGELLHAGRLATSNTMTPGGRPYLAVLVVIAAGYVAVCLALSALARWIERRGARGRG